VRSAVEALARAAGPAVAGSASRRLSDDLVLHLRLDKQRAFANEVVLLDHGPGDVLVVRLKLRAPRLTREGAAALVERAFGGSLPGEEE
jgi:RNA binding exosome subunit